MKKYAWLYKFAWTFEICAAAAGVVMAAVFTFPAYDKFINDDTPTLSATEISALLAGTVPFLLIAFAELTKIPFATAFIEVKSFVWKVLFGFVTLCLAAITFETISSGLETSWSLKTHEAKTITLQIESLEKKLGNKVVKSEDITAEHDKSVAVIEAAYSKRIEAINTASADTTNQADKRINDATSSLTAQINEIRKSQGKKRDDLDARTKTLENRLDVAQKNHAEARKALSKCTFCTAEEPAEIAARKSVESVSASLDKLQDVTITGDNEIKAIQAKLTKKVAIITAERTESLKAPTADRADADKWLKRNMEKQEATNNERVSNLKKDRGHAAKYKAEIADLVEKRNVIAQDDIVYRMSVHIFGKQDTEEKTTAKVSLTATVWFSSIGLIVGITGPFLAFAYIILNREGVPQPRKSKFRALARAIMLTKRKKEVIIEEKVIEVEKIVIEKEIIHVPIFTNDPDMIDLSNTYTTEGVK